MSVKTPKNITTTTKLYAFGSNGSKQLGVGHDRDLSVPESCHFVIPYDNDYDGHDGNRYENSDTAQSMTLRNDNIKKIVAGGNHTILLTECGHVYATGENGDGRCGWDTGVGTGNIQGVGAFRRVKILSDLGMVTDVAATWEASFFVVDNRVVYTCGSGMKGELGLGCDISQAVAITKVLDFGENAGPLLHSPLRVQNISGSMGHVVVLLSNGELYGWGSCRKGQLGESLKASKICWRPENIGLPIGIAQAVAGRDFTFLVDTQGEMLVLGDGKSFVKAPGLPPVPHIQLYSGWSCVYGLQNQTLSSYVSGNKNKLPSSELPPLLSFAAGSEHTLGLTGDRTVISWGWGEHGNCGSPVDSRGNVIEGYNSIELSSAVGEKIIGVAAGCATSFIWTECNG